MTTSPEILVTGHKGQLGHDLMIGLAGKYAVRGIDLDDLDLRNARRTSGHMKETLPDIVIHAAAFTDVDACESNVQLAMESNLDATTNVAEACKEIGARLIFFSTDYVFDGNKGSPYLETEVPNPRTVYGKSKLEAERSISERLDDYAILRIAWLYGVHGKNFPRTIIKTGLEQINAARSGKQVTPLRVVDDQIGNPTWTMDVVRQTEIVIENRLTGMFHCTSEGETSWYGLARTIYDLLGMEVRLNPCTTEEYPRPAPRPRYSSLENKRLKDLGLNLMRHYRISLAEFLDRHGGDILSSIQA